MVCTNKGYAFIFEKQSIYFLIKIQFFKCFDNLSNCQNIKKNREIKILQLPSYFNDLHLWYCNNKTIDSCYFPLVEDESSNMQKSDDYSKEIDEEQLDDTDRRRLFQQRGNARSCGDV